MNAAQPLFLSPSFFRVAAALTISTTLLACVYDNEPPRRLAGDDPSTTATPAPSGSSGSTATSGGDGSTTTAPILVSIDTNQVLNADPGQGVGVFTEYAAGGKWHVWWTCDTAKSQLPCDVALSATVASGTIDALDSSALQTNGIAGGTVATPTASRVDVTITTTTEVHGITFTTDPGAVLTLQATIGGLTVGPGVNQSFFFFVQNGQINGGYTGTLTNPLQFQGNTP